MRIRLLLITVIAVAGSSVSAGLLAACPGPEGSRSADARGAIAADWARDTAIDAGDIDCIDPTPGGGELTFTGAHTPDDVATVQGDVCPREAEVWTFSAGAPVAQYVGIKVTEKEGPLSVLVVPSDGEELALEPGEEYRASDHLGPVTYQVIVSSAGDHLAGYRLHVCRSMEGHCEFSEEVTEPLCYDPTPGGGGALMLSGFGTPNHTATVQGDVCPGQADTWSFSTLYSALWEHVGVKVTEKAGPLSIVVSPSDGPASSIAPGVEYRSVGGMVTYEVTISGAGDALASYRLHVCRSVLACDFSEGITPVFTIADVDCGGSVNSIDAALVLQVTAGLETILDCLDAADVNLDRFVNSVDAALILQFTAGLIAELPP